MKSEIAANSAFSVIFDGSTRLGEALAIIVRFIDKDWNIQQRLLKLEILAKSMNAEELAQRLIQCLAVEYGMQPNHLLAAMRDGASVNEAGLRQVMFFFPNIRNIICFSHTIDNVGKHFEFSVLDTFSRCWNTISCFLSVRLLGCCGRQELAQQCDFIPKPDGGANGKSSIRSWSFLGMLSPF